MVDRLVTRGKGGRTRGSKQQGPGVRVGGDMAPRRTVGGARSSENSHLGMRRVELAALEVPLRAQRRLPGRAPRQTGTSHRQAGLTPAGPGSRWRIFTKTRSRCESAVGGGFGAPFARQPEAADQRGVQGSRSPRGGGFPRPCRGSSGRCVGFIAVTRCHRFPLRVASGKARAVRARPGGMRSSAGQSDLDPVAPAGQRGRTPADGTDTARAAMSSAGRLCWGCAGPPPGAGASRRPSPESQTEKHSSSGLRVTCAPWLSLGAKQARPSVLGVPR